MTIRIGSQTIDKANILPNENEVLDETLDTFSFSLLSDSPLPFAPSQSVKITHEDNSVSLFVISSDSVEPYTLSKELYRHTIVVTENIRNTSKTIIKNSVFTQPASQTRQGAYFFSLVPLTSDTTQYTYQYLSANPDYEPFIISSREKVKSTYIEIKVAIGLSSTPTVNPCSVSYMRDSFGDISEINNQLVGGQLAYIPSFNIHYTYQGGDTYEPLDISRLPGGTLPFNKPVDCPQIAEIIADGGTNLYLTIGEDAYGFMFDGSMNAQAGTHAPFINVQLVIGSNDVHYYTCYDILDLLLKRNRQKKVIRATAIQKDDPFKLPQSGELYDLLTDTIAPNFTFTQCTLYEAIAEVFRVFDAIFTMDEQGYLGITYFNKRNDEVVRRMSGINLALGEERYVNGLISYYQDARAEEEFPANRSFAPLRSAEIGVPGQSDHNLIVPHAIQYLSKASVKANLVAINKPGNSFEIIVSNYEIDVSHYVIEKSVWSTLATTDQVPFTSPLTLRQNNTVFYQQGDNKISLGYAYSSGWNLQYYSFSNMVQCALFRQLGYNGYSQQPANNPYAIEPSTSASVPQWDKIRMRATYIATLDGRLELQTINDKFDGQMIIDQANGAVDLSNLGRNMLGLSYKMGEPYLGAVYKPTTWANRIKKGDYITFDGATWVANACNMTLLKGGYYQERVSFVKDYNELSLRKTLLREKRLSNVARNLTVKSEESIIEYCYMSTSSFDQEAGYRLFDDVSFQYCIGNSFGIKTDISFLGDAFIYTNEKYIYFPMIRYGAGNMVCLEMSFDDPMSAGIQTKVGQTGWFGSNKYYSKYVLYAEDDGFKDDFYIVIGKNSVHYYDDDFPIVNSVSASLFNPNYIYSYKQPNEITAFNYEIAFIPTEGCFIGRRFIERNFIVKGQFAERKLYIHYSTEKYTANDFKAKGGRDAITAKTLYGDMIVFDHPTFPSHDFSSWAIADEDGYFLFACNQDPYGSSKTIYFTLRRNRL